MEKVKNYKLGKLTKLFTLVVMLLTTVLSLVGCKLTNDEDFVSAEYDSNGNARVTSISLGYSPYTVDEITLEKKIDSETGVFNFVLPYYLKTNLETLELPGTMFEYDQIAYIGNFFTSPDLNENSKYSLRSRFTPFYASTYSELITHFDSEVHNFEGTSNRVADYTRVSNTVDNPFESGYYSVVDYEVLGANTTYYIGRVYSYTEGLISRINSMSAAYPAGFSALEHYAFPDLLFVVDGIEFYVRVKADPSKLVSFLDNSKTLIKDNTLDASALSFEYQTQDANGYPIWKDAPKGLISYNFDSNKGFVVHFNPRLQEGPTTRTIKVKALPNQTQDANTLRGHSTYSSVIEYNAYRLTFTAYSENSSTLDYYGLDYDHTDVDNNDYYFLQDSKNLKTAYSSALGKEIVTSVSGYFPEGRQVSVSRFVDISSNASYALQPWTTNEHSENSQYLLSDYTNSHIIAPDALGYNSLDLSDIYNPTKGGTLNNYLKTLFSTKILRDTDGFYTVLPLPTVILGATKNVTPDDILYFKQTAEVNYDQLYNLFYETTATIESQAVSTIYVTSCNHTSSYTFYGNFSKIQNFVLSGTIADGDKFFTNEDSALSGVTITVFDGANVKLGEANVNAGSIVIDPVAGNTFDIDANISVWIRDNEFRVTGLSHDQRIVFQKVYEETDGNIVTKALPYEFYGPQMSTLSEASNSVSKCLTPKHAKTVADDSVVYSDKINNAIIGTKYESKSNLEVNVYVGDEQVVDSTSTGVEIIKSTTSFTDENGYVTTNIILAISVPSNSTLVGYNTEMIQSAKKTLFSDGTRDVLYVVPYDKDLKDYDSDRALFYSITINSFTHSVPTVSADGKFLIASVFNPQENTTTSQAYTFDHSTQDADNYYSYYVLVSEKNIYTLDYFTVIQKTTSKADGTETFTLHTYTNLNANGAQNARIIIKDLDESDSADNYQVVLTYDDHILTKRGSEDGKVSITAIAYKTDLIYTEQDGYDKNGNQITHAGANTQNVYVYYDTKKASTGDYFLTAPIGRKNSDNTVSWYHGPFSNADTLITSGTIMLGSDLDDYRGVGGGTNLNVYADLLGYSMISYCYYYVAPLSAPESIAVSQFVNSFTSDEFEPVTYPSYYLDKGHTQDYFGKVIQEKDHLNMYTTVTALLGNNQLQGTNSKTILEVDGDFAAMLGVSEGSYDLGSLLGKQVYLNSHYTPMNGITFEQLTLEKLLAESSNIKLPNIINALLEGKGDMDLRPTSMTDLVNTFFDSTYAQLGNLSDLTFITEDNETLTLENSFNSREEIDDELEEIDDENKIYNYGINTGSTVAQGSINAQNFEFYTTYNIYKLINDNGVLRVASYPNSLKIGDEYYSYSDFTTYTLTTLHTLTGNTVDDVDDVAGFVNVPYDTVIKELTNGTYTYNMFDGYYYNSQALRDTFKIENLDNFAFNDAQYADKLSTLTKYYFENNLFLKLKNDATAIVTSATKSAEYFVLEVYNFTNTTDENNRNTPATFKAYKNYIAIKEDSDTKNYALTGLKFTSTYEEVFYASVYDETTKQYVKAIFDPSNETFHPSYTGESFDDKNLNNVRDEGEPFVDTNSDNIYNPAGAFVDSNHNGKYDEGELFFDSNSDGVYSASDRIAPLSVVYDTAMMPNEISALTRSTTLQDGTEVYLMGKYIMTNNSDPKIYPAFSSIVATGKLSALDISAEGVPVYSLDYTTVSNVIEGFPGVKLLAGAPYPNPVLTLQVKHKINEPAGISIVLDVKEAYYVELLTTFMKTETSSLIQDFSTVAFKDTITNLTQNDYIDRIYQLLTADDLDLVYGYIKLPNGTFAPKLTDANGQILPLTVQEVGINENDPYLYYADSLSSDGKYYDKVYLLDTQNNTYYAATYANDVILWQTSATELSSVPYYDIHSYTQGIDGFIYFNSGENDDSNSNCIELEGIQMGATAGTSNGMDYSSVLVGGTTTVYRSTTEFVSESTKLQGYFEDRLISIANPYDATDPYFLTGKESAVFIADPVVNLKDNLGESYIYRFKEWVVYTRYNSEILFYNRGVTEKLIDRYNAILRFSSNEAGYFVILPVYERVFTLGIGTMVQNGAINTGGSVTLEYINGEAVDMETNRVIEKDKLHFADFHKTVEDGKEGYYYSDIEGFPYIYFTGEFDANGHPIFGSNSSPDYEILAITVYADAYNNFMSDKRLLYIKTYTVGTEIKLDLLPVLTSLREGIQGIVEIENINGVYSLGAYSTRISRDNGTGGIAYGYSDYPQKTAYYLSDLDGVPFSSLLMTAYQTEYFYDGLLSTDNLDVQKTTVVTKLDSFGNNKFYAVNENTLISAFENCKVDEDFNLLLLKLKYKVVDTSKVYFSTEKLTSNETSKHFATSKNSLFAPIKTISNPIVNNYRVYSAGSLSSGELAQQVTTDDAGYTSTYTYQYMRYKTSYFDRDTKIVLTAAPDEGYIFDSWRLAVYDEELNTFVLQTSEFSESFEYSDLIIPAYYNRDQAQYFYVTEFSDTINGNYVYYNTKEGMENRNTDDYALVPASMLGEVRGTFVNDGTQEKPNYVQVYVNSYGKYFYDKDFTLAVSEYAPYKVNGESVHREYVELTYIDAIYRFYQQQNDNGVFVDNEEGVYYLSNQPVYFYNGNFYRTKSDGNITIEGNKITINNYHANTRFVAVFKELYNAYIFAEPSIESGVEVVSVLYYNTDASSYVDYADTSENPKYNLRYNLEGLDITDEALPSNSLPKTLYNKKNDSKEYTQGHTLLDIYLNYNTYKGTADSTITNDKYFIENGYTDEVYTLLGKSGASGALPAAADNDNTPLYELADDDGLPDTECNDLSLVLTDFYFVEDTVMYFFVRVESEFTLSIHSLGMNPEYKIEPIMSPTPSYTTDNQKLGKDNDDFSDCLYYIFKVTYNRDPENEDASLINHANRGLSMGYDVLGGRYNDFYSDYFTMYDNYGKPLIKGNVWNTNYVEKKLVYKLSDTYVLQTIASIKDENNTLVNATADILYMFNRFKQLQGDGFESLTSAFETLSVVAYKPHSVYVAGVKYSEDYQKFILAHNEFDGEFAGDNSPLKFFEQNKLPGYTSDGFTLMTNVDEIYDAIKELSTIGVDEFDEPAQELLFEHDGPFYSGNTNFINLSSIIVYTFTVETVTLDGYKDDGTPVTNTNGYHNLLDTFYTHAGSNGVRYVGNGTETLLQTAFEYNKANMSQSSQVFSYIVQDHNFVKASRYDFNSIDTHIRYEDVILAENTLVVFAGAEAAKEGYVFVGWFEQKFDKNAELHEDPYDKEAVTGYGKWSDLTLMSTELETPYVSHSTADTMIVALYKRVVNLSYTYNPKEVALSLSSGTDDLGNAFVYTADIGGGNIAEIDPETWTSSPITVTGTFAFDTTTTMTLTPVGGYRLDSIEYTAYFGDTNYTDENDKAAGLLELFAGDKSKVLTTTELQSPLANFSKPYITKPNGTEFIVEIKDENGNVTSTNDSYNRAVAQNLTFNVFDHLSKVNVVDVTTLQTTIDLNEPTSYTFKDNFDRYLEQAKKVEATESAVKANMLASSAPININLTVSASKVTVIYLELENYNINTDSYDNSNFAFALVDSLKNVYATIHPYGQEGFAVTNVKDSADNTPFVKSVESASGSYSTTLAIYIDSDFMTDKQIYLVSLKKKDLTPDKDIDAASIWYINGYATETTAMQEFSASGGKLYTSPSVITDIFAGSDLPYPDTRYDIYDVFELNFSYGTVDGTNFNYLNNSEAFDLNETNDIYYLFGRIVRNNFITISHNYVDNIQDLGSTDYDSTVHLLEDMSSTVIYRGAYFEDDGNISGNGHVLITGERTMELSSDTKLDLTLSSNFTVVDGKLYMFVGWFKVHTDSNGQIYITNIATNGSTVESGNFLNQLGSITEMSATCDSNNKTRYEARFVQVNLLELTPQTNGEIVANGINTTPKLGLLENEYKYNSLSSYTGDTLTLDNFDGDTDYTDRIISSGDRVVMNGSYIKVAATPAEGYIFTQFELVGLLTDINGTLTDIIPPEKCSYNPETKTFSYVVQVGTDADVNDAEIIAYFEEGINISVTQLNYSDYISALDNSTSGTIYGLETYIRISVWNEHTGAYDTAETTLSKTVPAGAKVKIEWTGSTAEMSGFTLVGIFENNNILNYDDSRSTKYFEMIEIDDIQNDVVLEARFTRFVHLDLEALSRDSSIMTDVRFNLSYYDFKLEQDIILEDQTQAASIIKVPSGTVVRIEDVYSTSAPAALSKFKFTGYTTNKSDILNTKEFISKTPVLETQLVARNNSETTKTIVSLYTKAVTIDIAKVIDLHTFDADKTSSQLFNSYFKVMVEYLDIYGNNVSATLSTENSAQIMVNATAASPKIKLTASIDDSVASRYVLKEDDTLEYSPNADTTETHELSLDEKIELLIYSDGEAAQSQDVKIYFDPTNTIFVSREVNNALYAESETPNVLYDDEYIFESDKANTFLTLHDGEQPTLTLTADTGADDHMLFAGWYVNGELVSNDTEYTFENITSSMRIVAKFFSAAKIILQREIDGEIAAMSSLPLYIAGNIVSAGSSSMSVNSLKLDGSETQTELYIALGHDNFATATHFAGYNFLSWIITSSDVPNTKLHLTSVGGDGLDYTSKITYGGADLEAITYTLTARYSQARTISYVSTHIDPTNRYTNYGSIAGNVNTYSTTSSNNVKITATETSDFDLRYITVYAHTETGIVSRTIDTENLNSQTIASLNLYALAADVFATNAPVVVEGVFGARTKLTVRMALEDSNDAQVIENSFGVSRNDMVFHITCKNSDDANEHHISNVATYDPVTNTYYAVLEVFAGDKITITPVHATISGNSDFYFNGYYLYDQTNLSIASSSTVVSYDTDLNLVVTEDSELVMKYSNKETSYQTTTNFTATALSSGKIETNLSIAVNPATNELIFSSTDGTMTKQNASTDVYVLDGKTYVFAGYFYEIKSNTNSVAKYLLASTDMSFYFEDAFQTYSNLEAVFVECITFSYNVNNGDAVWTSAQTHTGTISTGLHLVANGTTVTLYRVADDLSIRKDNYKLLSNKTEMVVQANTIKHYYFDYEGTHTSSITLTQNQTKVEDERTTIKIMITAQNLGIKDVSAALSYKIDSTPAPVPGTFAAKPALMSQVGDDNFEIQTSSSTIEVSFESEGSNQETITANISSNTNMSVTFTNTTPQTELVNLDSTISLSYSESLNTYTQEFVGYTLYGSNGTEIVTVSERYTNIYLSDYDLSIYSSLKLVARFKARYTLSLDEINSNTENATITVSNLSRYSTVNIVANSNMYIRDVLLAETNSSSYVSLFKMTNGYMTDYDFENEALQTLITNLSQVMSSATTSDNANKNLLISLRINLYLTANVKVKVVVEPYYKLNIALEQNTQIMSSRILYIESSRYASITKTVLNQELDRVRTNIEQSFDNSQIKYYYKALEINDLADDASFAFELENTVIAKIISVKDISIETVVNNSAVGVTLNSSKAGIKITHNGTDTVYDETNVGPYTLTDMQLNGTNYLTASDINDYYEFLGWAYTSDDDELVFISELEKIVLDVPLANMLDGKTLQAVFVENVRTIKVNSNYPNPVFSVALEYEGNTHQETVATTTLQLLNRTTAVATSYSVAIQMNEEQTELTVWYPLAAIYLPNANHDLRNETFVVNATSFEQKEYTIGDVDGDGVEDTAIYHEYLDVASQQNYRFKAYTAYEGMISNYTEYSPSVSLGYSVSSRTLTASAVKLYSIELMSNYVHDDINLYVSSIVDDGNGNTKEVNVAKIVQRITSLSPNEVTGRVSSIITYLFEEGSSVQIKVDYYEYANNYNTYPFNTIAFSTDPTYELNSTIAKAYNDYYSGSVEGYNANTIITLNDTITTNSSFWLKYFPFASFKPISQIDAFTQTGAGATQTENLSEFNFSVVSNMYFIADFFDAYSELRYYVNNTIGTPTPSTPTDNSKYNYSYANGATFIEKTEDKLTQEFNFTFVLAPMDTTLKLQKYENNPNELNSSSSYIFHTFDDESQKLELDSFIDEDGNVYQETEFNSVRGQTTLHVSEKMYTEIKLSIATVNRGLTNEQWTLVKSDDTNVKAENFRLYNGTKLVDYDNYFASGDEPPEGFVPQYYTPSYYKFGETIKLTAMDIEGYFFQGFVILNNHKPTLILSSSTTRINDTEQKLVSNYTFLQHSAKIVSDPEYGLGYQTSFKANGSLEVVALYEPMSYVVEARLLKYDTEKQELTDEEIISGKIKGNLVAEQGKTLSLTALSYNFVQFYGWTAGNSNSMIPVFTQAGAKLELPATAGETELDELAENKTLPEEVVSLLENSQYNVIKNTYNTLKDNEDFKNQTVQEKYRTLRSKVYETTDTNARYTIDQIIQTYYHQAMSKSTLMLGYDGAKPTNLTPIYDNKATDGFTNLLSKNIYNNIYIPNVNNDLSLNLYYGTLDYTLTINLEEIFTGFNYDASESGDKDTYIAYSDEYIESKGGIDNWVNPSYGYKDAIGNVVPYGYTGVSEKDKFVYTIYDNHGNLISADGDAPGENGYAEIDKTSEIIATKVMSMSVDTEKSHEAGIILLKTPDGSGFPLITSTIDIAKRPRNTAAVLSDSTLGIVRYLEKTLSNNEKTKIAPYNDSLSTPNFSNVYDILERTQSSGATYLTGFKFINDDLFTIKIGRDKYNADYFAKNNMLMYNANNATIQIKYKVFANEMSGFPNVTITTTHVSPALQYASFELENYESRTVADKNQHLSSNTIKGFHNGIRNDVNDPNFQLPELDFTLKLKYQYTSKEITAYIMYADTSSEDDQNFTNGENIYLTGKNSQAFTYDPDKTFISSPASNLNNFDGEAYPYYERYREDILSYNLYIIRQGRSIIDLLMKIINSTDGINVTTEERGMATKILAYIYSFSPEGDLSMYKSTDGKYYLFPVNGLIEPEYQFYTIVNYLNRMSRVTGTNFANNSPGFLEFNRVDVFGLFKQGIDYNYKSAYMNSGDAVVMASRLNEQGMGQKWHDSNHWSADKPFTYYKYTIARFDYTTSNGAFTDNTITTEYSNYYAVTDLYNTTDAEITSTQAFNNYIAGIFNGSERYKGCFHDRVSACITPDSEQFSEHITQIQSQLIINRKYGVKTADLDWFETPLKNIILAGVVIGTVIVLTIAGIVGSIWTGGASLKLVFLVLKVAAFVVSTYALADLATFAMSGKKIDEHLSNLNFKPATPNVTFDS